MITFYNTLSGKIEPFRPIHPKEVKLYTCGPTVYDYSHIGNYRAYVFEDLLKRFLNFMGYKVFHVMNLTDVDDKTIKGAREQGISLEKYTQKYKKAFFEDIQTLNIIPADIYPEATAHIKEMARIIQGLLEKGFAYRREGSVYFNISKFPGYGKLSKIKLDDLKPGQRIDSDEYEKESVYDFALWKNKKEGEPSWKTGVGEGRPGWHIECSAMSSKYLGENFDIHCGGVDNIFPHHENEIAQSEAFFGKKFVNYWLHCHHLVVNGEKMAKSKGNFYTLRDLMDKNVDPLALRFLLLSTHYRKMLNFTFENMSHAEESLKRIGNFVQELKTREFKPGENKAVLPLINRAKTEFTAGLSDDLNFSSALSSVFELIRQINTLIAREEILESDAPRLLKFLQSMDKVLGVLPKEKEEDLDREIKEKIALREKARSEKNYILADKIRADLLRKGIQLEDTKDGVRWKFFKPKA